MSKNENEVVSSLNGYLTSNMKRFEELGPDYVVIELNTDTQARLKEFIELLETPDAPRVINEWFEYKIGDTLIFKLNIIHTLTTRSINEIDLSVTAHGSYMDYKLKRIVEKMGLVYDHPDVNLTSRSKIQFDTDQTITIIYTSESYDMLITALNIIKQHKDNFKYAYSSIVK